MMLHIVYCIYKYYHHWTGIGHAALQTFKKADRFLTFGGFWGKQQVALSTH
jgi:hypothetical protein